MCSPSSGYCWTISSGEQAKNRAELWRDNETPAHLVARKAGELSCYAESARWLRGNLHRSFLGFKLAFFFMLYDLELPPPNTKTSIRKGAM